MAATATYNVSAIRKDFPILSETVHGKPLVYLDNAATTQKPRCVIDAIGRYYAAYNANIHRGVHTLSQLATEEYENARETVRAFINARSVAEVIFTRGTTESVNLVASAFGSLLKPGDEIVITHMEHHSNIVPWQMLCQRLGTVLRVAPITDEGELDMDAFRTLLTEKVKLVSAAHVSNSLGTINPVAAIVGMAHAAGAKVLLDGAQAVQHLAVDVQQLDCDFYAFSGHKIYGPTGTGVLFGKEAILEQMPPYQGGGDMISSVTFEKTSYNTLPYKFEAGTPHIAGGIALGTAMQYLQGIGVAAIAAHEQELLRYASAKLSAHPRVTLIGTARDKCSVLSFTLDGIHPHDIGTILDFEGVAIRTGHHCTQPVMQRFGIPATARASFGMYNTLEEVDIFINALDRVFEMFG